MQIIWLVIIYWIKDKFIKVSWGPILAQEMTSSKRGCGKTSHGFWKESCLALEDMDMYMYYAIKSYNAQIGPLQKPNSTFRKTISMCAMSISWVSATAYAKGRWRVVWNCLYATASCLTARSGVKLYLCNSVLCEVVKAQLCVLQSCISAKVCCAKLCQSDREIYVKRVVYQRDGVMDLFNTLLGFCKCPYPDTIKNSGTKCICLSDKVPAAGVKIASSRINWLVLVTMSSSTFKSGRK